MTQEHDELDAAGWRRGADGMRERSAARVVLLDAAGRVLLVRGHDVDLPERSWWFTVGGGIDPGETPRGAAVREVREETGIALDDAALVGPVGRRSAVFDFAREHCRQHEVFFVARLTGDTTLARDGWTALEREVVDDVAWLTVAELRSADVEVFPRELPDLVEALQDGWDGVEREIGT